MDDTSRERENLLRLLQSGKVENIECLGLKLAQALNMDIQDFVEDIEVLYQWPDDTPSRETVV
jgi:hypothetical protein